MAQLEQSRAGNEDSRNWIFDNAIPTVDDAKTAISTARTLTLPSKHTIDGLESYFKGTVGEQAYSKFLVRLDVIGKEINARNKKNRNNGKPVLPPFASFHYPRLH